MNTKTNLNHIADELRQNCDDTFSLAMLTLVEALDDVGDSEISGSYGNIGIRFLNNYIELVDIEAGKSLLSFTVNR